MFDWGSLENEILLNPRLPENQADELKKTLLPELRRHGWQGHFFLLTSGTTARTLEDFKWVALSKKAVLASAEGVNRHLLAGPSDIWLNVLPSFHVGGIGIRARAERSGSKVLRLENWQSETFVQMIKEHRVTLTALVPTQIFDLVRLGQKAPSSLRAVIVGGGALSPTLYQQGVSLGWPLLPSYGMTEAASQIATASLESLDQSQSGDMNLSILPHMAVNTTSEGRIKIQSEALLSAYIFRNQGKVVVLDPKQDGFLISEDYGKIHGNTLKVLGRGNEIIKIGGETVSVNRLRGILEEIAVEMKMTSDMDLLPVPDERLGYVIHLVSDQKLGTECSGYVINKFNVKVLPFERIREWSVLEKIPRTELGKLKSQVCLEQIGAVSKEL